MKRVGGNVRQYVEELLKHKAIAEGVWCSGTNGDRLYLTDGTTWMVVPEEERLDCVLDFLSTYQPEKLKEIEEREEGKESLGEELYEDFTRMLPFIKGATHIVKASDGAVLVKMNE